MSLILIQQISKMSSLNYKGYTMDSWEWKMRSCQNAVILSRPIVAEDLVHEANDKFMNRHLSYPYSKYESLINSLMDLGYDRKIILRSINEVENETSS